MPRGAELKDTQCAQLVALKAEGLSLNMMTKTINKSSQVIAKCLNAPQAYKQTKRSCREPSFSPTQKRILIREVRKAESSARDLVNQPNLPISTKPVQAILSANKTLAYNHPIKGPYFHDYHVQRRFYWVTNNVGMLMGFWDQVDWSEEKNITLEGLHGSGSFQNELKKRT